MPRVMGKGLLGFLLIAITGCGASSSSGSGTSLGVAPNAPRWVRRGSVVEAGSIFGVGLVTGVNNPALARSTADNRARKEISRVLETYSASLMKDYAASTSAGDSGAADEVQLVEEAVKTYSARLVKGVEIRDHYVDDGQGALYALAELNFDRAGQIAAALPRTGSSALEAWLDRNRDRVLADLKDQMKGAPARPAAEAPDEDPAAPEGAVAPRGGPAPAWKDGACDRNRYLCGVGDGVERRAADVDARAEIARIFRVQIKSVEESFDRASQQISSKTGEQWFEASSVSSYSMVSTEGSLVATEIRERWVDDRGTHWSLALLERSRARRSLTDRIEAKDRVVSGLVAQADGSADQVNRLRNLQKAVLALLEREALNADLRVVATDGRGIQPPITVDQLVAMLDAQREGLRFGLALAGRGADAVRDCLEESLTERGFTVAEVKVDEEGGRAPQLRERHDVIVQGSLRTDERGRVSGGQVVKSTLVLKLVSGRSNKVVTSMTGRETATRRSVQAAISTAVVKICRKQVPNLVRRIDRYFGR